MSTSAKPKAVRRVVLSTLFLSALVLVAATANDPSLQAVAVAFAVILGVPFLLLSLVDLGRILRSSAGGNFRASRVTWLLSHLQAAFGATCMAAAVYAIYQSFSAWLNGTEDFHGAMLLLWVPIAIGLVLIGFSFIRTAFVSDDEGDTNSSDT